MRPPSVSGFLALAACVTAVATGHRHEARHETTLPDYDYVIVGSGPGGGPLAARLARAGKSVLLIDAGGDQGDAIEFQVPVLSLQSTEYTPMRWDYYVTRELDPEQQKKDSKMTYITTSGQKYIGKGPPPGAVPKGLLYPRAGALGGCSAHNALITIYPHNSDWNKIAELTRDTSWTATNMRKYFQRIEKCEYLPNGIKGHGFTGWLTTSLTDLSLVVEDPKLLRIIVNAVQKMGQVGGLLGTLLNTVTSLTNVLLRDLNADVRDRDTNEGVYQMPIATDNGFRATPREFILSTANAKNPDGSRKYHLDIMLDTLVTKIRFDEHGGPKPRAVGVNFLTGQSLYSADPRYNSSNAGTPGAVNARNEVIISAGTFNTPQLLKLSGIGPASELSSLGIPVLVNLPGVGSNMQDRYETTVIGEANSEFRVLKDCTFYRTGDADPCLQKWKNGINPLTKGVYATNGIAVAITKKSSSAAGADDADLFLAGAPAAFRGYYEGYSTDATLIPNKWFWLVLKAHSRNKAGTVRLRSTDPRDMPQIDFNQFSGEGADLDADALVEGMKLARDLVDGVNFLEEIWPGEDVDSDAKLKEFVKTEAWGHHACCTCPIGKDTDPMAVLDSQFRVRGVDSLRVVDASVFPEIPGYFIAVPVYMISEKAADVILGL